MDIVSASKDPVFRKAVLDPVTAKQPGTPSGTPSLVGQQDLQRAQRALKTAIEDTEKIRIAEGWVERLKKYAPWVIGGGVALILVVVVLKRRKA